VRSSTGRTVPADLVLTGAAVYTADAVRSWAGAVAVRSGRIVAVGSEAEIRPFAGRRTRVLELPGRMVVPGFQDAHVHPPMGGLYSIRCDLHGVFDRESYVRVIARYAEEHPDSDWIVGGGWSMDAFPGGTPEKAILDALVPDRPVFLKNRDGHGAWVNSQALAIAGVTRETADPPDGRIERDAGGEPTGTLQEGAMALVELILPATTEEEWEEAVLAAQAHLHALGITAWQDAWVTPETQRVYRALAERGQLTARVVGALWWERDRGEEQVEELIERREEGSVGHLRCGTVKIMQDGVMENFTAGLLEPYLDTEGRRTENRGIGMVEAEALKRHVTRLDREGFQVHIHAIGDRAVREALDAFEAAQRANGLADHRHHIAHIQLIDPADIPRFRALGVVANAQPFWAVESGYIRDLTLPFLGPERSRWLYPFASLRRAGAVLAFGSDWTVSTADPLLEMEVAVNRVRPDARHEAPFLPEERLDLPAALAAFTIGSAYVNHLDDETGSIEPGKLADLVVLDRDLFAPDAGPIGDARVLLTLSEGEAVYADPETGW